MCKIGRLLVMELIDAVWALIPDTS
jgi:hypothetical protein